MAVWKHNLKDVYPDQENIASDDIAFSWKAVYLSLMFFYCKANNDGEGAI